MENWYSDNPLMDPEMGIEATKNEKANGYVSYDELESYNFLKRKIYWLYIMGNDSYESKKIRIKKNNATTKLQSRTLIEELGLLEELESVLKMTQSERLKAETDYMMKHFSYFKNKHDQEEKMLNDELDKLESKKIK